MKKIDRNEDGLINGVDYVFTDDGLIDWRKMVKPEHLVPNKDRTSETDVTKLKDYQLIILLGGIKELAQIRGYTDVKYDVVSPSSDYVVATCTIIWKPNYETEGEVVVFSATVATMQCDINLFPKPWAQGSRCGGSLGPSQRRCSPIVRHAHHWQALRRKIFGREWPEACQ